MQPDYITRLNSFTQANDLEIGFRSSKRMSLFWRLFDLPAKPLDVKDKTRFGVVRGQDGGWYRSDMDLAYIWNLKEKRLLFDDEVELLLDRLNAEASGKIGIGRIEFKHPTHWTFPDVMTLKDPHPGSLWVLNNQQGLSGFIPRGQVKAISIHHGLGWPFGNVRFASRQTAITHYMKHVLGYRHTNNGSWIKHKGELMVEFKSIHEYNQAAQNFLSAPRSPNFMDYIRSDGDLVRLDPNSGYFGVITPEGTIRTFFRPHADRGKNIDYFYKQIYKDKNWVWTQ